MVQFERYSRQVLFKPIGSEGQQKLLSSRVAIIGAGALGTVVANHLARSGVGHIRIIDRDLVEMSNLQRQILFDEEDARNNLPKALAAKKQLLAINSTLTVDAVVKDLNLDNAEELLSDFDCFIDGTDNFITRYILNDVSVKLGIPWIHGGAVSSRGMFAVFIPGKTPCYRCLFPSVPSNTGETCDTVGVLSPLTDIIGSYQALEAIKLLVGARTTTNLEQIDIWDHSSLQMDISDGRNPNCPTCVQHQYEFLDRASTQQTLYTSLCGRETVQINPRKREQLNLKKLAENLKELGKVTENEFLLQFAPEEGIRIVVFKDARVLIHGTNDIVEAKKLYTKYIGT